MLLYLDPPINPASEVGFTQAQMRTANAEVAALYTTDQVDTLDSWLVTGTYAQLVTASEILGDGLHLTAAPYDRMAAQLAGKLRSMAGVP